MMYVGAEGWADDTCYNSCKRHPYFQWTEDLLCLAADVG